MSIGQTLFVSELMVSIRVKYDVLWLINLNTIRIKPNQKYFKYNEYFKFNQWHTL